MIWNVSWQRPVALVCYRAFTFIARGMQYAGDFYNSKIL